MNVSIFTLLGATALFAADEQQLALALKAQSDFDRVQLVSMPSLHDAAACVQTQAALLAVAPPEELPSAHFRKGYCTLATAAVTHEAGALRDAAAEFDKAIETWPGRVAVEVKKKQPVEAVSSGLRVLAQVARLQAAADDATLARADSELGAAVQSHSCPANVMSGALCESLLDIGRQWQGWIALRRGDLSAAGADFSPATAAGWKAWAAGKQAFRDRNYAEATTQYRRAVSEWEARRRQEPQPLLEQIAPAVDLPLAYTELGGAELLAGDKTAAVATLNQAVKAAPMSARALYLRGSAREAAGDQAGGLADYSLAARTAFANAQDLASGEGHLYRGILLYRRKDFEQAEEEFSSALNFDIPANLRADAGAWRRMAAVAAGSCGAGRQALQEALPTVSPYFPVGEARALLASCASATAARQ